MHKTKYKTVMQLFADRGFTLPNMVWDYKLSTPLSLEDPAEIVLKYKLSELDPWIDVKIDLV